MTLAHCAVSTASAATYVDFNVDFYGHVGTGRSYKGRVKVPLSGALCGVYNNLGGDNYQFAGVTGLIGITGQMGDLLGFQFQNVQGANDINAVARTTVVVKLQRL